MISTLKYLAKMALVLFGLSALCACATVGGPSRATLEMGGYAPAPRGVAALCAEDPTACGMDAAQNRPAAERRVYAALQAYSDLMRARTKARTHVRPPAPERTVVALTQENWAALVAVNSEMNAMIAPISDMRRDGVSDYWEIPRFDAAGKSEGDCEEYALAKRARLLELGWSADVLRLATADVPGAGKHAVLIVQTDQGDFVLDNLKREPMPVDRTGYRWLAVQASQRFNDWRFASVSVRRGALRRGFDTTQQASLRTIASVSTTSAGGPQNAVALD